MGDETDIGTTETIFTLRRRFEAPPERVFDEWIGLEGVRQWLFTTPGTDPLVKSDATVGGTYPITDGRGGEDDTAVISFVFTVVATLSLGAPLVAPFRGHEMMNMIDSITNQ